MKNSQLGRSMVEMLAVLAIIGILSLGGIAGYTMATTNNRANKILDTAGKLVAISRTKGMSTTNESAMMKLPDNVMSMRAEPDGTIVIVAPSLPDAVFQSIQNNTQGRMTDPDQKTKAVFLLQF